MEVIQTKKELREFRNGVRGSLGFVPTMGALHEGHAALIRQSAGENERTVVSIFVNPMQFGPREDLAKYPRPFERDLDICRETGANVVYAPDHADIYPAGFGSAVEVSGVGDHWCGASRPGHFVGVATVVLKLLNRVQPDRLYLGQKDAQQAALLDKMVLDLDLETEVVVCPTIRGAGGLALSSRNQYLSPGEKAAAPALYRALMECGRQIKMGQTSPQKIAEIFQGLLPGYDGWRLDYFGVADPVTMSPVPVIDRKVRLLAAAFLGTTRLIDNISAGPGLEPG